MGIEEYKKWEKEKHDITNREYYDFVHELKHFKKILCLWSF